MRALWVAMDEWSTRSVEPPPSAIPMLADGTLAKSTKQADVGFPTIPGVQYTGLKSTRYLLNYGPDFDKGIMSINPPPMQSPYFDNPATARSTRPRADHGSRWQRRGGSACRMSSCPVATYTGGRCARPRMAVRTGARARGR